jgi:hypothetical protein
MGLKDSCWDYEMWLPLSLVRTHTKTDDIMHVTDEQLRLYRQAAIESCETYTGVVISGYKHITETLRTRAPRFGVSSVSFEASFPPSDGIIYYRGPGGDKGVVNVPPKRKKFKLPVRSFDLFGTGGGEGSDCCAPCADGFQVNNGYVLTYRTGYGSPEEVPGIIKLGCLKFIAWSVEHAGDVLVVMANTNNVRSSGILGSNNVTWASGALELWRQLDPEGI